MPESRQILVIDCQTAGISGDMMLGALIDIGIDENRFIEAMNSVKKYIQGYKNLEVIVTDVQRKGFRAKKVEVRSQEERIQRTVSQLKTAVANAAEELHLSERAKTFAQRTLDTLIEAEAKIHGESAGQVHLHETASADTVVDIVGAAFGLDELGLFSHTKIYSTPVAVGGGLFKFSHGTVSSPAPATIEILRSKTFPMIGGPAEFELTTPTGAAILTNLADATVRFYPPIKPKSVGYGAGAKDLEEIPNILRVLVGQPLSYNLLKDEVFVLETNLDDVTGEVIGYVVDKLFQEGARDVTVISMSTKNNRPGHIIKVITGRDDVEKLSLTMMRETGTLGVRIYPCERLILNRTITPLEVEVDGAKETINVKVSTDSAGEVIQVKPEFQDVKRLAERTNKPLRTVWEIVMDRAHTHLKVRKND
ncbi:MAG: nickel pincer cofactor biosynthesis protein LarC [Aigarchaeota archaeon]|nr:nickel pincer cofactor biosynthesis protein LarC [Aigarchaeota archaeon]MDH5702903.1 nickel pincer cofactor biosynthesis protein LarC [Aigarchaeota archaeon]